jgi:hypothetical protein
LAVTGAPFTLEQASDFAPPISSTPRSVRIQLSDDTVTLATNLDVDYWEVDPNWDGVTFKSAAQACRPVRRGTIPYQLKTKIGGRVCIRFVTANGKQYQLDV